MGLFLTFQASLPHARFLTKHSVNVTPILLTFLTVSVHHPAAVDHHWTHVQAGSKGAGG